MQVIAAKVISVNETDAKCDCDPADGGPTLHDVRLRSSIDGIQEGIIPIPAIDSYILVGLINNDINQCYVVSYTSISKITIICDDIRLNGDAHGSMIIIQNLVNKINQLEQTMSIHQHAYVGSSGPAVTTPGSPSQMITPQTTVNDLANTKVKHG